MEKPALEFTELEHAAVEQILTMSLAGIDAVRRQFEASRVVKREYTGVGFYTDISVPPSIPRIPDDQELREHLIAGARVRSAPGELILFQLWITGGYLSCLEATTTKGLSWPDEQEMEVVPIRFREKGEG